MIAVINLWDPTALGIGSILVTAFLLGMVHGVTPDEHTWPITFSYAISSYSTKKGMKKGFLFSLAFTIQRAILSEIGYFGLAAFLTSQNANNITYLVVGMVMAISGYMMVKKGQSVHLHLLGSKFYHKLAQDTDQHKDQYKDQHTDHVKDHYKDNVSVKSEEISDLKSYMPLVHGFIAGWGLGAFALIIVTVLAPGMHSAEIAWLPGALFGIGTMVIQVLAGGLFGSFTRKKGLNETEIRKVALKTSFRTLKWGGIAFFLAGLFGLVFPSVASFSIATGVHVHNLDSIGIPIILVIIIVPVVGIGGLIYEVKKLTRIKTSANVPADNLVSN
jgi:ABC-type nickel/cobalt efflux system permease component RcnA